MLRAFIAIKLSDELKRLISRFQSELQEQAPELRGLSWVRPDSMHVTLRFLGDIQEDQVEPLSHMVQRIAPTVRSFALEARGLGAFPNVQRARVLWLGLKAEPSDAAAMTTLRQLQRSVEEGVVALGFQPEQRAFTPHLTLARVKERAAAAPLARMVVSEQNRLVGTTTAASVILMRSELRPQGSVYTTLVEEPLSLQV